MRWANEKAIRPHQGEHLLNDDPMTYEWNIQEVAVVKAGATLDVEERLTIIPKGSEILFSQSPS